MKEASGELSMTAVAVVAIAAIGVLFTTLIYPSIKNSLVRNQLCSAAYNCRACTNGVCTCTAVDSSNNTTNLQCDDPSTDGTA